MLKIFRKYFTDKINIHKNITELLLHKKIELTKIQKDIFTSINKEGTSMILCDEFSGRKFSTVIGLMNKVLNNPNTYIEETDFYRSPNDIIRDAKKNASNNITKKTLPPRGILFISHKFDFVTPYYKMLRKFDNENKIRAVRLGNSLQSVTPTVEVDVR